MASELSLNAMVTLLNPAFAFGRGPGRLAIRGAQSAHSDVEPETIAGLEKGRDSVASRRSPNTVDKMSHLPKMKARQRAP
jgi:hypothetical protein